MDNQLARELISEPLNDCLIQVRSLHQNVYDGFAVPTRIFF